jgi:hypothetical protein
MKLANNSLINRLQSRVASQVYNDTASILVDTVGNLDVNGQPTSKTTAATSVACSFTDKFKMENWAGYADISEIAAELRYNSSPAPAKGYRVTLTGRFGDSDFTDETYEIIGIRDRGDMGYKVALKVIEI